MLNFNQLSFFDVNSEFRQFILENNHSFFDLFHNVINFSDLIPQKFYDDYYKKFGTKRKYSLESMLLIFIYKNYLSVSKISTVLNMLSDSNDLLFSLGLTSVPSKATVSKFKNHFVDDLHLLLDSLVEEINPSLQNLFPELHQYLVCDTTGVEAYVTENNPKFLQSKLRKANKYKKHLENNDTESAETFDVNEYAYSLMPKKASANKDIKLSYLNGHFGYFQKVMIITNGLGVIQDIQFPQQIQDFTNNQMPETIKDEFDSKTLIPSIELFKTKHHLKQFNYFLGDAGFDAYDNYKYLYKQDLMPFIPINPRASNNTEEQRYFKDNPEANFYFEGENLICKKTESLMKYNGKIRSDNRADRVSYRCPKSKRIYIDGNTIPYNTCDNPCTDAKWGRKVNIAVDYDYRYLSTMPRSSEKWQNHYKKRTVCERSIAQFKNYLNINATKVRKTESIKSDILMASITQLLGTLILIKSNNYHNSLSIKAVA